MIILSEALWIFIEIKKNELLRNLDDEANLSEKWGVEKKDIMKKILPGGRVRSETIDPWLDKKY